MLDQMEMLYPDKIIINNLETDQVLKTFYSVNPNHNIKLSSPVGSFLLQVSCTIHLKIQDKTETNGAQLTMGWYFRISSIAFQNLRKQF